MNSPRLTFVVCSYNGGRTLRRCLEAIVAQIEVGFYEVIVIANGCTDDSVGIATAIAADAKLRECALMVKVVDLKEAGKSRALACGCDMARGEFVAIIDDDNYLPRDWASRVLMVSEAPDFRGILGTASALPPATSSELEISMRPFLRHFAVGEQWVQQGRGGSVWGAGCVFRASVWRSMREAGFGFCLPGRVAGRLVAGEDSEFCAAAAFVGAGTQVDNSIVLEHDIAPGRLTQHYLQRLIWSEGMATPVMILYAALKKRADVCGDELIYKLVSEMCICLAKCVAIQFMLLLRIAPIHLRLRVCLYRGIIRSVIFSLSSRPFDLVHRIRSYVERARGINHSVI